MRHKDVLQFSKNHYSFQKSLNQPVEPKLADVLCMLLSFFLYLRWQIGVVIDSVI